MGTRGVPNSIFVRDRERVAGRVVDARRFTVEVIVFCLYSDIYFSCNVVVTVASALCLVFSSSQSRLRLSLSPFLFVSLSFSRLSLVSLSLSNQSRSVVPLSLFCYSLFTLTSTLQHPLAPAAPVLLPCLCVVLLCRVLCPCHVLFLCLLLCRCRAVSAALC